jgi:o-succinylbenzoate synthase
MADLWPSLSELLDGAVAYRIPLSVRFRGLDEREGLIVRGPSGWAEFAPFADYEVAADVRWLGILASPGSRCGAGQRHRAGR